ncbi:MAG: prepilin-type N-terminal cleavage/methylation domain-containing protein [Proteobacteria bacterium]|nr:prepilin-type N-terminal cleavage/methylation domain-containing protein [Pseudomonadota bacterium]MBU1386969.1 prepilin-type N-terminal cleavage/methylation domain-containing protein [Pseudomonadota bacterium]MBU1542350.1 prepilin-type N-terminal cleavage/methylation domain-containing protein [Pseudomonadota bacterium]MBU2480321.1 prepilin-type N-terminal cleavage/methylation domain-containing protein [Pseudomonadota bacterium]
MKPICLKLKNKLSGQEAGFSLIEVLIAMAVLSIGLLSIAAMQTSAIKGNAKSNHLTQRTFTAATHIEYLLNIPFTHPDLTDGAHTQTIDGDTYTWTVTTPADRPNERIISLTLTNTYYGENRTLTMNTKRVRNQ